MKKRADRDFGYILCLLRQQCARSCVDKKQTKNYTMVRYEGASVMNENSAGHQLMKGIRLTLNAYY